MRKTVTVLFCDLVGSTALGERVDAESARDVMGRYRAMAQQVIEGHGGHVAKFIGDGVMALFGVPDVAVDDAERAVATGLGLQRGFLPLGELISDRYGVEVGLRVGVNTGELVIADADADIVGDVVNTAARLEGACTPGQVLVGEGTWRLSRSAIRYEPFGHLELHGKADAVATFRAVDEALAIDESTTPFVGRDAELSRLEQVYRDAVVERSVRLATVIGAPGVGKTRLSQELRRSIADEAMIVDLRCERAGSATFTPVADLLRVVAGIDDSTDTGDTISGIRDLLSHLDDADRVAALLGGFVGAAPMRSTEEVFFAVRRLVEALGRRQPFVVVIDDIQWAEPLMLDMLEYLAEWVQDSPVMVLGLARPELRDIRPTLTEQSRRVADSISLDGLDARATVELAAQLVGAGSLPNDLVARLSESTEGNPLFVRELMKMLVDDGVITETDGTWELTIDAEAVAVPPTIQSLLATRIERMPTEERRLLEYASVVGPDFSLAAVAAIGAPGDIGPLAPTLERLRRKELVAPTGTYWGNEPLFRFHHVLIRDAAYRRLLKGTRAELHVKVGAWTEETAASIVGEHEVTIGYHFEQAHEYRRQLNIEDDETRAIGRRAAELFSTAAGRALARDDVAAAGSLATRAVRRLEADAEKLPELLMLGCEAWLAFGDVASARYLLKQLTDLAVDDLRLAAWAACFNSQLVLLTEPERLHEADAEAAAAAERLRELGDDAGEAKARLIRAGALARLGHIGESEDELDLALTAARRGNDARRVAAVLGAAPVAALWGPSPLSHAGGRCLDVIRLVRISTGSPGVEAISTRCQAVIEALRGRFHTARTMLAEAHATVEELGLRHGLLETELYSGIIELLAGDPIAAEPHLRTAYGGLGRLGIGADAGQAAAYLSRALLLQGRLDEADELAADSATLAGQNPQTAIVSRTAQAEILVARGQLVDALHVAEAAVELAAGTDIVIDHANANVALARVRLAAGDVTGAQRARDAAVALYDAKGATVDLGDLMKIGATVAPMRDGQRSEVHDDTSPGDHEAWTEADRLGRQCWYDFCLDAATWAASLSPDIEVHDRRPVARETVVGREAVTAVYPPGSVELRRVETVATRGDHLVLFHTVVAVPDGTEAELLLIQRWTNEGLLDLSCRFAPNDRAGAIAELDRLYLDDREANGITRYRVRRLAVAGAGLSNRDVDHALSWLDEAAELVDHRHVGGSNLDLAGMRGDLNSWLARQVSLVPWIARVRGDDLVASWVEVHVELTGPEGVAEVAVAHLVLHTNLDTGLIMRIDLFTDDQLDEAHAQFDEAGHDLADRHQLSNVAALVVLEANSYWRIRRRAAFARSFADEVEISDSLGTLTVGDRAQLDDPVVARRCGLGVARCRVMAIRGDRFALLEHRDDELDEPIHCFVVAEVDADERLVTVAAFDRDSLAEAVRHLGYRWLESAEFRHREVAELSIELTHANSTSNGEWARRFLSEDCAFVDHRRLGWPTGDKASMIEIIQASAHTRGASVNPEVLAINDGGRLISLVTWTTSESGELVFAATPAISVMQVRDGQISAIELFAEDELAAARVRFDELTEPPAPKEQATDA